MISALHKINIVVFGKEPGIFRVSFANARKSHSVLLLIRLKAILLFCLMSVLDKILIVVFGKEPGIFQVPFH